MEYTPFEQMEMAVGLLWWQNRRRRRKLIPFWLPVVALMGVAAFQFVGNGFLLEGCHIKGNISAEGERIYHVPGGKYYDATRIKPAKGERWFCTETEARAAGWRRARR